MIAALAFLAAAGAAEAFVSPMRSSFAANSLSRLSPTTSLTTVRMVASAPDSEQFAVVDAIESSVAPKGGGFWFGSAGFWGEETYRGFVDSYKPNNLINGVYPIIDRVRATKILTTTSESGLLSELEDAGLTLSEAEKLLPQLEELGLLSFVADNGDVLINLFGFLAVEPAKLAIPVVVSLVKFLKGAGVLKLGGGDSAPEIATIAATPSKSSSGRPVVVKRPAPKASAPAPKPKPKASAPRVAAPKTPRVKVAPRVSVQPVKVTKPVPAPRRAAPKPVAKPPSAPKGNISNIPKAL